MMCNMKLFISWWPTLDADNVNTSENIDVGTGRTYDEIMDIVDPVLETCGYTVDNATSVDDENIELHMPDAFDGSEVPPAAHVVDSLLDSIAAALAKHDRESAF